MPASEPPAPVNGRRRFADAIKAMDLEVAGMIVDYLGGPKITTAILK